MENLTDEKVHALDYQNPARTNGVRLGTVLKELQQKASTTDQLNQDLIALQSTVDGKLTANKAAYVSDPAGDAPTKAEFAALRDALVAAGLMEAK
jgi:hypothetical protein